MRKFFNLKEKYLLQMLVIQIFTKKNIFRKIIKYLTLLKDKLHVIF